MKQNCHWWLGEFQWLIQLLGVFSGMQAVGAETKLDGWLPWSAGGLEAELEMLRAPVRSLPHLPVLILNSDCRFQPETQTQRAALLGKGRGSHTSCFHGLTFSGAYFTSSPPFLHQRPHLFRDIPRPITPCCLGDCGQNYLQKSHLWIRVITVFIRKPLGLLLLFSEVTDFRRLNKIVIDDFKRFNYWYSFECIFLNTSL